MDKDWIESEMSRTNQIHLGRWEDEEYYMMCNGYVALMLNKSEIHRLNNSEFQDMFRSRNREEFIEVINKLKPRELNKGKGENVDLDEFYSGVFQYAREKAVRYKKFKIDDLTYTVVRPGEFRPCVRLTNKDTNITIDLRYLKLLYDFDIKYIYIGNDYCPVLMEDKNGNDRALIMPIRRKVD